MKVELMDYFRHSIRNVVPVFAVICFSIGSMDLFAQDSGVEKQDAKGGQSVSEMKSTSLDDAVLTDVALGEAENTERNKIFNETIRPLLSEAAIFAKDKQYQQAYQVYATAKEKADPQKMGYGPYVLSMNDKIDQLKLDMQKKWAKTVLQEANSLYLDTIKKKNTMETLETYVAIKEIATDARAIYYTGRAISKRMNPDELDGLVEKDPAFSVKAMNLVSDCDKFIEAIDFKDKTSLATIDPDNKIRKDKIHFLMKGAETAYKYKEYTKARDNLEMILVMDPYYIPATTLLSKVYRKIYQVANSRIHAELLADMAAIEWGQNQAVLPVKTIQPQGADVPKPVTSGNSLYEKLQHLIIDSIEFDGANIVNVISYITQKSKEVDPDGQGVNIVLNILPEESEGLRVRNITLDRVPLLDVLRYICQQVGLKYRIEEKTVIIGSSKTIDEMELNFFLVRAAIVNSITNNETGTGTGGNKDNSFSATEGFDGFKPSEMFQSGGSAYETAMKRTSKADSEALKEYFRNRGVPFEEGTAIAYNSRSNKLAVYNTPENLRKLEALIRDIDIQTPLVLIESKILEVKINHLEELGFDWLLTHTNTDKNWTWSMESPIRSSSYSNNKLINNMNILPNFGGDNVFNLYLTVTAIDRTDRAEILSTPKVIATSGSQAIIRMVQEMYFPDSWTEPETSTSNGSSFSFEPSYPEFGDTTDIGIVFSVLPTVSPNNYTMTLQLNPEVLDLTGWSDYSYDIVVGDFNTRKTVYDANGNPINTKVTLKMPEISRRAIETNVKVYDGETVVLGGMLIDKQSFVDDQWPLLGEVPIIGRLFANQSSNSEKSNLLISVTPRLMSGDGVPVRTNPANGLPDFRR